MVRTAGEQGSLKRTATGASAARGAASLSMGTFHRKENSAVPARKTGIARMETHWRSLFLFRFLPLSFPPVMEEAEAWHGFPAVSISKCRVMKRCRAGCHCGGGFCMKPRENGRDGRKINPNPRPIYFSGSGPGKCGKNTRLPADSAGLPLRRPSSGSGTRKFCLPGTCLFPPRCQKR